MLIVYRLSFIFYIKEIMSTTHNFVLIKVIFNILIITYMISSISLFLNLANVLCKFYNNLVIVAF